MQRIFSYAGPTDYALEIVALCTAIASGVALALVNLVFGEFITVISDYGSRALTPGQFRSAISRNA